MKNRVKTHLIQAKQYAADGNRNHALDSIRKALAVDPGEILITEVLISMERTGTGSDIQEDIGTPDTSVQRRENTIERNNTADMDAKLEKLFNLSDEALSSGNNAKALAYLKKALKLFPEASEAEKRLQKLKNRIRAGNLVKIGLKKVSSGDIEKAISASRKAFDLLPAAEGLKELLSSIEAASEPASGEEEEKEAGLEEETDSGAQLWADRIRTAVKDDKFEEAGEMVAEAVKKHPGDTLLDSFYSKLKRLGFVTASEESS
ncbi:MAG: hypothetical protein KAH54_00405 [Candidatus Sabulitectum sp.]|nr:hypothetical protein [Candidatus Sabulitectum sp.]